MLEAVKDRNLHEIRDLFDKDPRSIRFRGSSSLAPIHLAVDLNDLEVVKLLLSLDADLIDQRGGNGISLLHVALYRYDASNPTDCRDMIEYICARKPSIMETQDALGRTPMYVALDVGAKQYAKLLHTFGFDGYHMTTMWGESCASLIDKDSVKHLAQQLTFCRSLTEVLFFSLTIPVPLQQRNNFCVQQ